MTERNTLEVVVTYIALFLFYVALVMVGWNVGLYGAGIAIGRINWATAVGLSVCLMILRGIAHAAAPTTISVTKP